MCKKTTVNFLLIWVVPYWLLIFTLSRSLPSVECSNTEKFDGKHCKLPPQTLQELSDMSGVMKEIHDKIWRGPFSGTTYKEAIDFLDFHGARLVGTKALEKSITDIEEILKKSTSLQNIRSEKVPVTYWSRNTATIRLLTPVEKTFAEVFPLTSSVPTPEEGIEAEVIYVTTLKQLLSKPKQEIEGKIVLFHYDMDQKARNSVHAAGKRGAVAAILKSYTDFSLYTLHLRGVQYKINATRIPGFSVTIEDSEYIVRMIDRGYKVRAHLFSNCSRAEGRKFSRNLFGTLPGQTQDDNDNENSTDYVITASHLDSTDLGQGAQDDGIGIFLNINALRLIDSLSVKPKRNIQLSLFTAEETGLNGVKYHYSLHREEVKHIFAALEADMGCFKSAGWVLLHRDSGEKDHFACILFEIGKMLGPQFANLTDGYEDINPDDKRVLPFLFTDVLEMGRMRVPVADFNGDGNENYFWYHHSRADTVQTFNSTAIDECLTFYTTTLFMIANLKSII